MKRRTVLHLTATALAAPGWTLAQAPRRYRAGLLVLASQAVAKPHVEALVAGLRERGYVSGGNLTLDVRYADGDIGKLPALADELIALKPDVLMGIEGPALALKAKTSTIPIILVASADPVASGLVQSLARPGTNVTGLSFRMVDLIAKQVELLTEIAPKMRRAALFNLAVLAGEPLARAAALYEEAATRAAAAKGVALTVVGARDVQGVAKAFETLERERCEGLVVAPSGQTNQLRRDILEHARRLRLPSISGLGAQFAEDGGTVHYGLSITANYRYVGTYVDRVLKGAKPAEIPVEQTEKFEVVVNLKAAREIGVTIPRLMLLRADRVIE